MHNKKIQMNTKINKIKMEKTLYNILFISILFSIFIIIYLSLFSENINISPFGIQILKIESNSMIPEFKKNDIIIIKKVKEYSIGDIVTFVDESGNFITHRIIEKCENEFYTKGDNNNTKDEKKVTYSQILGKVIMKIQF